MSVLEAVKKGFGGATKLVNVMLIFFGFNVIIGLISLPLTDPARAADPGAVMISVLSSFLFFLVFIFLQGGALGIVKDNIKTGAVNMASFVEYGKKFYLRILGLLLLYIVLAIAVVLLLALISSGLLLLGDNVVMRSIVALLVTLAAVAMITILIFPIYTVVVEDVGPFVALKKGISVAKDNFVKTLGLFMALLVISMFISLIIGFFAGLITIPLGDTAGRVLLAIVNSAIQSYLPIVMMIAFMSFYMVLIGSKAQASGQSGSVL